MQPNFNETPREEQNIFERTKANITQKLEGLRGNANNMQNETRNETLKKMTKTLAAVGITVIVVGTTIYLLNSKDSRERKAGVATAATVVGAAMAKKAAPEFDIKIIDRDNQENIEIDYAELHPNVEQFIDESILTGKEHEGIPPWPLIEKQELRELKMEDLKILGREDARFPKLIMSEDLLDAIDDNLGTDHENETGGYLLSYRNNTLGADIVGGFIPSTIGNFGRTKISFSAESLILAEKFLEKINAKRYTQNLPPLQLMDGTIHTHPPAYSVSPDHSGTNGDMQVMNAYPHNFMIIQKGGPKNKKIGIWEKIQRDGKEYATRKKGIHLIPSKKDKGFSMYTETDEHAYESPHVGRWQDWPGNK